MAREEGRKGARRRGIGARGRGLGVRRRGMGVRMRGMEDVGKVEGR